jgi:hypothetical protein
MSEIYGQLHTGRPLSERECFQIILEGIGQASAGLRGLAASRKDARWLLPVRILDEMTDRVKKLMVQGGARIIWLPNREPR